ncbi:MAG: TIGR01777 family protein [Nitriliruptorales bacterium]|nr:TIGR01777 family protein [Nitriliruptorales bacterium]
MRILRARTELPVSAAEAFAWHERPGALERLKPPWAPLTLEQPPTSLAVGTQVVLRAGIGPFRTRWVAEHVTYDPPHEFRDVMRSGPFSVWNHRHLFEELADDRSALVDEVTYRLPVAAVLDPVLGAAVDRRLRRMFEFRHRRTAGDLARHRATKEHRLNVAISGASGMIGRSLSAFLTAGGHTVVPLVRREARAGEIRWDPQRDSVDADALRGVDAVVHLAAEPFKPRPMTAGKRRRLRDSRIDGTRTIATALARMDGGPRTLVSASGANWYGDRGDEELTESSAPGAGDMLCEITKEWEEATEPARQAGIRVVQIRTGVVLDRAATVLQVLGSLARLGATAPLGGGQQYWPWISMDDTIGIYHLALTSPELEGPVNTGSPNPVTNEEFTRTLARVLHRPVIPVHVPRFVPAMVIGRDFANSLLFTSMRMVPRRAVAAGYEFRHPTLEGALRDVYGR